MTQQSLVDCKENERSIAGKDPPSGLIDIFQTWPRANLFCVHGQKENSAVFRYSGGEGAQRRDVVKLDDMLGHSSVETTRIYLISAGVEHAKVLS